MDKGILILGHGSRSQEAQEIFTSIVAQFQALGYDHVKGAHMELCAPSIDDAVAAFIEEGIFDLVVLPLFLYPGIHLKEDIPQLLADLAAKDARLHFALAKPLLDDPLIVETLAKRYREAADE